MSHDRVKIIFVVIGTASTFSHKPPAVLSVDQRADGDIISESFVKVILIFCVR